MKGLCLIIVMLLVLAFVAPVIGQEPQANRFWTAARIQHAAGSATVVSSDPRPLWMALNAIEREYRWLVDYEDPLYEDGTEVAPHHNLQWENTHPGVPSRVPAGTSFTSTYREDSQTATSMTQRQAILTNIVRDYNSSANPGRFEVRSNSQGRVNIVGYSRNPRGKQTAVLDTPITISPGITGSLKAFQELIDTLTEQSGVKVVVGVVPWNLLAHAQVSIKSGAVPARVMLTDIADSPNERLIWDFLYDVDSRSYFLSLRPQSTLVTGATERNY